MGIDIYAMWKGQSKAERNEQDAKWLCAIAGREGYLREAYHGEPYATKFLCSEAFKAGGAKIAAAVLRERLPNALALVAERFRKLYNRDEHDFETEEAKQSFRDFVSLCELKELETGEPVLIIANF